MIETRFTRLLGCSAPIQAAAMPGISGTRLVSAVAAAGGLGMLPAPLLSAAELERALDGLRETAPGAFGVNFLVPFLDRDCVTIAARGSRLVEFFYGDPERELVEHVHACGARVGWQVGSVAEAVAAEGAGCDLVVAQGTEAGGHVRGHTSLLPLLSQVLEVLRVPVLAAGGIASARDLAAVLACGADGARIGTRFVAATESEAHPVYVQSLLDACPADTCLTEAFSAGWPDAPHRVLRSAVDAVEALRDEIVGETRVGERVEPVPRGSPMCPTRDTKGHIEAMALYAGESVAHVRSVQPAASIVAELVSGAARALAEARV